MKPPDIKFEYLQGLYDRQGEILKVVFIDLNTDTLPATPANFPNAATLCPLESSILS